MVGSRTQLLALAAFGRMIPPEQARDAALAGRWSVYVVDDYCLGLASYRQVAFTHWRGLGRAAIGGRANSAERLGHVRIPHWPATANWYSRRPG